MGFEWDSRKAVSNLKKHGVDFADAVTVLFDELAVTTRDEHPGEDRFVNDRNGCAWSGLGGRVYLARAESGIVSARKATRTERSRYESGV